MQYNSAKQAATSLLLTNHKAAVCSMQLVKKQSLEFCNQFTAAIHTEVQSTVAAQTNKVPKSQADQIQSTSRL